MTKKRNKSRNMERLPSTPMRRIAAETETGNRHARRRAARLKKWSERDDER
jgi:hypothetical protein